MNDYDEMLGERIVGRFMMIIFPWKPRCETFVVGSPAIKEQKEGMRYYESSGFQIGIDCWTIEK